MLYFLSPTIALRMAEVQIVVDNTGVKLGREQGDWQVERGEIVSVGAKGVLITPNTPGAPRYPFVCDGG